jgi:hypothetical protein
MDSLGAPMADDKPTPKSITDIPCTCGSLQLEAADTHNPIVFRQGANGFELPYRDECGRIAGAINIYHCPFCGGVAPKSEWEFVTIPTDEQDRLAGLLKPIVKLSDALNTFGEPDMEIVRELLYNNLSDTADVFITEQLDGKVNWELRAKAREKTGRGT